MLSYLQGKDRLLMRVSGLRERDEGQQIRFQISAGQSGTFQG